MGNWTSGPLKAVVLDLDDTLYDKAEWLLPALEHAATLLQMDVVWVWECAQQYVRRTGCADVGIYNDILLNSGQSDSAINIRAFVAMCNLYKPPPGSMPLVPGGLEALTELHSCFMLAVIADGPVECQKDKIIGLGIGPLLKCVVYSDEIDGIRSRRPDPRPYRKLLQELNCRPEEVVFVGDNPLRDFQRANALGMRTVRVLRGEYAKFEYPSPEHCADYDIPSISQLPRLLQRAGVLSRAERTAIRKAAG